MNSIRYPDAHSFAAITPIGAVVAAALLASTQAGAAEETTPSSNELAEVVVTGSLITDPNHVSPSPIVITTAQDLRQSGSVSIESALNAMPQFSAAGTSANGGQGTGGHATVNLHALGSNRNLVLLDGRRLPLADIFGDVDVNFIPESILSSVQTITGGASAIYGSDAMSGVVNFITLSNFEGMTTDLQYGNSMRSDYGQFSGSTAFGTKFADDRGHALLSLGYTYRQSLSGSQRGFFNLVTPSSFIGQGTFVPSPANLPNPAAVNALFSGYGVATPVSNTLNLGFNDDGTLFTQTGAKNYKGPTSNGYAILGGNVRMPVGPQTIIENPLNRKSVFSKVDYQLVPGVTVYGQALYVDSTVTTSSGRSLTQFGNLTIIPATNPFIPADLATLLATRPTPTAPFTWNGRYVGIPVKSWDEHYTTAQYLGGLRGGLPFKDWTWDVFSSYDATDHVQSNFNAVLKSQVQSLLNGPDGGNSLCAGGFDPFALANSSAISPACQSYMTTTAHSTERLTQTNIQGTVQGQLFSLPAGDAVAALLADFRRNTYNYSPDSNLASQNIEAVIASKPSTGAIGVKEFAAQVDVPLLSDLPFIRKLSLGAAFRHSDYTTSGGVNSYEGDLKWTPVQNFLVRGGYQRAVRAPNIGELFSADTGSQIAFGTPPAALGDPCDVRSSARTGANGASVRALCLAQGVPAAVIDSYTFPTTATAADAHGNAHLQPETADTYNFGFSWTPHGSAALLSNLSVSLDYYNIKISKVISVVPGLSALSKCYNLDGSNSGYSAVNEFCQLLHRDANGLLQLIDTPYLNLGGLKSDGVDLQVQWSLSLSELGFHGTSARLFANMGVGYLHGYSVQTLPGSAFQDYAGTNTISQNYYTSNSFPKWKAVTTIGYAQGGAAVSLRWKYQNAMQDVTAVTTPANRGVGVPAYSLVDLLGSYEINTQWQLRAGIINLGNHGPVLVSSSQFSTDASVFDVAGRSYYVGVRLTL
jgi:iron complex outermembrane receptor protein